MNKYGKADEYRRSVIEGIWLMDRLVNFFLALCKIGWHTYFAHGVGRGYFFARAGFGP